MKVMQIEIISDPSCFETLKSEWHDLLQRAETNHVFITPEFQQSWWETLGEGELKVITFRHESHLIGIAPLFIFTNDQGKKQLSFIGCVNVSDYLDVIFDRTHLNELYQELTTVITKQITDWEVGFLCSLPTASSTRTLFTQQLDQLKWSVSEKQQDVCPVIQLPKTWEEYLQSIGKKQRHEIKRKWEKLFREAPAEFELIEDASAIRDSIDDFISLHQKSSETKSSFWDDDHVKFFRQFAVQTAEKGWLKLYFVKIKEKRVAAMLGFSYNGSFFLYNSGFDADEYRQLSVGNVLTSYTIQQAIERQEKVYDFLRGDEEYKFRYGAIPEPVYDLTFSKV